jgi:hypothetical protein
VLREAHISTPHPVYPGWVYYKLVILSSLLTDLCHFRTHTCCSMRFPYREQFLHTLPQTPPPPCSAEDVKATSESLCFLCFRPLLLADMFSINFFISAISEPRVVLICVMSRWMPMVSSVSFVSEHITALTSSSSFDCSFLKAARS